MNSIIFSLSEESIQLIIAGILSYVQDTADAVSKAWATHFENYNFENLVETAATIDNAVIKRAFILVSSRESPALKHAYKTWSHVSSVDTEAKAIFKELMRVHCFDTPLFYAFDKLEQFQISDKLNGATRMYGVLAVAQSAWRPLWKHETRRDLLAKTLQSSD